MAGREVTRSRCRCVTGSLPGIAAEDIVRRAYGIFQLGPTGLERGLGIVGEHLHRERKWRARCRGLSEWRLAYNAVPPDVYRGFGFPGAEDIGNMFQYNRDFAAEFGAARSIEGSRELNPKLQTFSQWLEQNKSRIPLE